jgi:hypothetical protein
MAKKSKDKVYFPGLHGLRFFAAVMAGSSQNPPTPS